MGEGTRVKKLLRYRRIKNTMKYISMIHSEDDEFEVTIPTRVEETKHAPSIRFHCITERDGMTLIRRPKRFCGINAKSQV